MVINPSGTVYHPFKMAGKRKKTHWAVRRKNKRQRSDDGDAADSKRPHETADRRTNIPESIHAGSYALQRQALGENKPFVQTNATTKRRYGIWIAYCGKNYSGMQLNEGVKTIEAELERALFEAGGIAEANYGFLQKIGWNRAARTDKGVHAAGQLISVKLHVAEDETDAFVAKVNALLPSDIRVLKMVSVTKNFSAKLSCDQRTYEYLAPTFLFARRETEKAVAVEAEEDQQQQQPSSTEAEEEVNNEEASGQLAKLNAEAKADGDREGDDTGEDNGEEQEDKDEEEDDDIEVDEQTLKCHREYRMSEETLERLNQVLGEYIGTLNFHNFTSKLDPTSPKCKRYITSFIAEKPFLHEGLEWVRLRVVGQSFLLHHIRKMIGTAAEIVAGVAPPDTIQRATQALDKMDLPKAPGIGLYLAQAHFNVYNTRMSECIQTSHPLLELDEQVMQTVEQFKKQFIFEHIIAQESEAHGFAKWLHKIQHSPLSYRLVRYQRWKVEKAMDAAKRHNAGKRAT